MDCNSQSFTEKGLWDWQKINQALNRENKCICIGILYSLETHLQLKVESQKNFIYSHVYLAVLSLVEKDSKPGSLKQSFGNNK